MNCRVHTVEQQYLSAGTDCVRAERGEGLPKTLYAFIYINTNDNAIHHFNPRARPGRNGTSITVGFWLPSSIGSHRPFVCPSRKPDDRHPNSKPLGTGSRMGSCTVAFITA